MYDGDRNDTRYAGKREHVIESAVVRARKIRREYIDPRRNQERDDFNLLNEDHNAMANLPRMAQHHEFSRTCGFFLPEWD
jgi:hypothetical protein